MSDKERLAYFAQGRANQPLDREAFNALLAEKRKLSTKKP